MNNETKECEFLDLLHKEPCDRLGISNRVCIRYNRVCRNNCDYKKLLAEQAKNKKLVEVEAIKDKMIELMLKEINCNYTGNSPNPHSRCKHPKCDECKTYFYKKQAQQALNEVNK
jgi:hypothetical protein